MCSRLGDVAGGAEYWLIHFDTHTDTGTTVFGVERSHGTPMYRPGEPEFALRRQEADG